MRVRSNNSKEGDASEEDRSCKTLEEWKEQMSDIFMHRSILNGLIANYLLTEGFKDAAIIFSKEAEVPLGTGLTNMDERIKIRTAVQQGNIDEAMKMVTTLNPEVLDNNSELCFHLQQLVLLEFIREGNLVEGLKYAQKHLADRVRFDAGMRTQLERTMGLIGFNDPHQSPFRDLLSPNHRLKVASELNAAILKAQNVDHTSPLLCELVRMMLWCQDSLKDANIKRPEMTDLTSATLEFNDDSSSSSPK